MVDDQPNNDLKFAQAFYVSHLKFQQETLFLLFQIMQVRQGCRCCAPPLFQRRSLLQAH